MLRFTATAVLLTLMGTAPMLMAVEDPADERHEMMEEMGDAAGALGAMLKGEAEFDSVTAMDSFIYMRESADVFVDLFPEGSYTGGEKKAAEAVWTDRAGFDQHWADFTAKVDTAIAAEPQSLDALKPVTNGVLKECKACHEDYRIPGD